MRTLFGTENIISWLMIKNKLKFQVKQNKIMQQKNWKMHINEGATEGDLGTDQLSVA